MLPISPPLFLFDAIAGVVVAEAPTFFLPYLCFSLLTLTTVAIVVVLIHPLTLPPLVADGGVATELLLLLVLPTFQSLFQFDSILV